MLCVMYTLRSNNCALGLKSQFAIITCSHLKPVLRYFTLGRLPPISSTTCQDLRVNIDLHLSDEDSELVHSASSNNSFIIDL